MAHIQYEFMSIISHGHPIYLPEYDDQEKFSFLFCDWVNVTESDYWAYSDEDDVRNVTLFFASDPALRIEITADRILFLTPFEIKSMTESEYTSLADSIMITLTFINIWFESFPKSARKEFIEDSKDPVIKDIVYSDDINMVSQYTKSIISDNKKYDLRVYDLSVF